MSRRAGSPGGLRTNSKAGSKLRLRAQGLADGQGGQGDFYLVVRYALPADLSPRQLELLREMEGAGPSTVSGGARLPVP